MVFGFEHLVILEYNFDSSEGMKMLNLFVHFTKPLHASILFMPKQR